MTVVILLVETSKSNRSSSDDSKSNIGIRCSRDAIEMMRIIAERTLEIDEELFICFIDWQKAFDRVNWNKLMHILKISGIDWRERRLISKLYMDQIVKVRLD